MGWILLLLLVVAGPGPGPALSTQLPRRHHHSSSFSNRHLLQDTPACNAPGLPGCKTCDTTDTGPRCLSCAGSLLLLKNNMCGCPAGTFASDVNTCRDCPKGSFCLGGMYTGEVNVPPATPCTVFGGGLTTLGSRTTRKEGCINLPGYYYTMVGDALDPAAIPCPPDTYQFGLRKQRACVPCPTGMGTFNKTMQTSILACDVDACTTSPCGKNMDCMDLPKPAGAGPTGRTCKCVPGTTYVDDFLGCSDPSETPMIGATYDQSRSLQSFEINCPRGAFVVAISGSADTQVQSIGPLGCSDGTTTAGPTPLGFGLQSGSKFTTALSPDGFTGLTVTAALNIMSVSFYRKDQAYSPTYGTLADVTTQQGRRQFLTCPNYGVATGIVGVRTAAGVPAQLGLVCSGLPCPVRTDTIFGPIGANQQPSQIGSLLQNSPAPVVTNTATQCCSICTRDFRCMFWVREDSTGNCWSVYREPMQAGVGIPQDWTYQQATGYQAGATQPKTSGISVFGTYVGCNQDSTCSPSSRMQATLATNDPQMTVKKCLDLGQAAGWDYVGLGPGVTPGTTNCFAGQRLPPTVVNPGCFAACSGNSSERCGDNNCVLSIYAVMKQRWPLSVIDQGDPTRGAGWYDVQCQGAINDYCRWLGRGNSSYFSCALAGSDMPATLPGQITEAFANSAPCQAAGYRTQPLTDLSCIEGDLSQPWDNNCRNRQCCKAKCDGNPLCTGFVFGNSPNNNCRSTSDGQNCCWLKGGQCKSVFNPVMTTWQKSDPVMCTGFPTDPAYGLMFCPDNANSGQWPQGTRCTAECMYGILDSDQKPYAICLSNGQWSDVLGLCKPPCDLPPLLCP